MYRKENYSGAALPPKTICLTYDDGPGKDTLEIAAFLAEYSIRATFFVVGKYAVQHHKTLEQVSALGHIIGNHTYEHPDIPYYVSVNGDICEQVLRTDAIIKPYVKQTTFFRAPYGKWSAEVANELQGNFLATINHVGPIHWDVGGIDCYYWKLGHSVDKAVERYLRDIEHMRQGIVVMHDEIADMAFLKPSNRTLELTKKLIPKLLEQGYSFIGLDEIESVKQDALQAQVITLKTTNDRYLATSSDGSVKSIAPKPLNGSKIIVQELSAGSFAFKGANELYFSMNENTLEVAATQAAIGVHECFDIVPVSSGEIIIRAYNGNYLTINKNNQKLVASAPFMRQSERFTFNLKGSETRQQLSFYERLRRLKKRLLYIKSKIEQST